MVTESTTESPAFPFSIIVKRKSGGYLRIWFRLKFDDKGRAVDYELCLAPNALR